jgi:hypothetical protein
MKKKVFPLQMQETINKKGPWFHPISFIAYHACDNFKNQPMRNFLLVLTVFVTLVFSLKLVKIKTPTDPNLLEQLRNIDIHYSRTENVVIVKELSELHQFEILSHEELGQVPPGYKNYDEILMSMQKIAREHPQRAKVINLSSEFSRPTIRGNSIYAIKVSVNPNVELDLPKFDIMLINHVVYCLSLGIIHERLLTQRLS